MKGSTKGFDLDGDGDIDEDDLREMASGALRTNTTWHPICRPHHNAQRYAADISFGTCQ